MTKISIVLGFLALSSAFWCNRNTAFPTGESHNDGINAFLLIVEKDPNNRGPFFKIDETYAVAGSLHSCLKGSEGCACEGQLKSSIDDLLTWAGSNKEMSTASLYQAPPIAAMKQGLGSTAIEKLIAEHGPKSSMLGNLKSLDFKPMELLEAFANQAKTSANMWLDSFETLLQNMSRIREKKILLSTSTSESQLPKALEIFKRYFSLDDTLLIVLSGCSQTENMLPFVARGPGSEYLKEIKEFNDVAPAIQQVIKFYNIKGLSTAQKLIDSNMSKSRYPRQDGAADTTTLQSLGETTSEATKEVPKTTVVDKLEELVTKKVEKSKTTTEIDETSPKAIPEAVETSPAKIKESLPKVEVSFSKPKEVSTQPATTSTKTALLAKYEDKLKARSDEEGDGASLGESIHPSLFLGAIITFVTLCMSS